MCPESITSPWGQYRAAVKARFEIHYGDSVTTVSLSLVAALLASPGEMPLKALDALRIAAGKQPVSKYG